MDARQARHNRRYSKKQEKRVAADLGGRTQANSGATRLGGGADVRAPGTRVECKFTSSDRYVLKLKELDKLRDQAVKRLEEPVFQFAFKDDFGRLTAYAVRRMPNYTEAHIRVPNIQITLERDAMRDWVGRLGKFFIGFCAKLPASVFQVTTWESYLDEVAMKDGQS